MELEGDISTDTSTSSMVSSGATGQQADGVGTDNNHNHNDDDDAHSAMDSIPFVQHEDEGQLVSPNHVDAENTALDSKDFDFDVADIADDIHDEIGETVNTNITGDTQCQCSVSTSAMNRSPLPDHDRKTVLSRMFRWPFFALDVLYRFVTHPNRSDTAASASRLNQVVSDVQQESRMYKVFTEPRSTKSDSQQMFYKDLRSKLEETSMSSCFSGIDTPATSFMCLAWAVTSELERSLDDLPSPKNIFAVEILSASQQELLHHPHAPQHIFGDMQEFWKPCIKEALPSIMERGKIEDELIPVVLSGVAARDHAYCLKHQCICKARQWAGVSVQLD